jgi:lipid A 3-O-deacylase
MSLRTAHFALPLLLLLPTAPANAVMSDSALAPQQVFAQAGFAREARAAVIGLTWSSPWQRPIAGGVASLYWEASFGRWASDAGTAQSSSAWVTQIGLTPVLRWQPGVEDQRWFLEAGIGANVLLPVYRSRDKRFSTAFNFGDHVAVGLRFGEGAQHELALRLQHFSNAGIKHPNPGENFVQLRYSHPL